MAETRDIELSEQFFTNLQKFFNEEELSLKIIFIKEDSNKDFLYEESLFGQEEQKEIIMNIKKKILKYTKNSYQYEIFDPILKVKRIKRYLEIDQEDIIYKNIFSENLTKISLIDKNFKRYKGYVLKISSYEKSLLFFKKIPSQSLLKGEKSFLLKNSKFKFVNGNIFNINYQVDFFLFENIAIIEKDNFFIKLFKFDKSYREKANNCLQKIKNSQIIENFDKLEEKCINNFSMIKKLYDIEKNGLNLDFEIIKNFIDEYKLKIEYQENNKKLIYDDKKYFSIWTLLSLFSDDYLYSKKTGNKYIVYSKKKVNNKENS